MNLTSKAVITSLILAVIAAALFCGCDGFKTPPPPSATRLCDYCKVEREKAGSGP